MKKIKIKETYLLFLIVIGLVSLSLYTTYALFIANTEITDVVSFSTNLTTDSSILEYEMVTVPAGETKTIELVVTNSHTSSIYYGVWYQSLTGIIDMNIGVYTEKNSTPASGTIDASSSKTILIGISNDSSNDLIINIGVVGSETSNLNLSSNRTLITDDWAPAIIVTPEYLEEHMTTSVELQPITPLEYTTPAMTEVTLQSGEYKLEAWGAQGGSYSTTYVGGKGGYSYGTLTLTESTKLYVYVGGQATTNTSNRVVVTGGFNGGGNGYNRWYSSTYTYGQGGGGSSDIRIGTDSLYARVIVAGGGSGSTNRTNGYYGGGETSGTGRSGYSASQTAAGTNGSFGTGGSATTSGNNYKYGSAGGGGGWYGGGASSSYSDNTNYDTYSGGGSGYVYTSSTYSNYPSGCLLNSKYYLTNAATVAGNTSFTDFSGSTVTGRSGNGAVRISGSYNASVTKYTIPRVLGLTDLYVPLGNNVSLTSGVSYECETGSTSCTYIGPNITDTSSLEAGEHTIYYTIKDSNGKKYIYSRTIAIKLTSEQVLTKLGLTANTTTPDFSTTATTNEGVFAAEDDLGTSYYFRGAVTNNYVKFAGFYWRIIRINGDGSIRMIYDGTSAHANGESSTDRRIGTSVFNSSYNDNTYVGYMNGTVDGTNFPNGGSNSISYTEAHTNRTNSTIKTYLDNWYKTNIVDTGYSGSVVDAIYCNDRSVDPTGSGTGIGTSATDYGADYRLYSNQMPTLKCSQVSDRFTTGATVGNVTGNDKLTYPVGLITADEVSVAGGVIGKSNSSYYLYTNNDFWTMSPYYFGGSNANEFLVDYEGFLINDRVDFAGGGVRPVITLSSSAITGGTGISTDPFVVSS